MERSMEIPSKTQNRNTKSTSNSILINLPEGQKIFVSEGWVWGGQKAQTSVI